MENKSVSDRATGRLVLAAAVKAWRRGGEIRSRRSRYKRFTYGDQWSDPVPAAEGGFITEGEAAVLSGKRPLTNNLIRRLVKCVVGRFRMMVEEETVDTDSPVRPLYELNNLDELDSRLLEEFLISGCAIQRVSNERRPFGSGVWVDNVAPDRFFINEVRDPRCWDAELVGMYHDLSRAEAVMRFARGDAARAAAVGRIIDSAAAGSSLADSLPAPEQGRVRVFEVWTLQASPVMKCHDPLDASYYTLPLSRAAEIADLNAGREADGLPPVTTKVDYSIVWHCRWIASDGSILDEYDSPLADGGHPFVIKLYPLVDGEIHSFVEDVIDQQLCVNRLITLIDHIVGTSAKGALLFPVDQKIPETDWMDIARMWAAPDGVIPYAGYTDRAQPQQVVTTGADGSARELLSLQLKMLDDVAGMSNALMGKSSVSAVAGIERYESEMRNAIAPINDLLKTFLHFRHLRDTKMLAAGV